MEGEIPFPLSRRERGGLPHVAERNVLGERVEHLEQPPEPQVSGQRLVHHHELAPEREVGAERQALLERSVDRSGHGAKTIRVDGP